MLYIYIYSKYVCKTLIDFGSLNLRQKQKTPLTTVFWFQLSDPKIIPLKTHQTKDARKHHDCFWTGWSIMISRKRVVTILFKEILLMVQKSCYHQLIWTVYAIFYRVLYIAGRAGFPPSQYKRVKFPRYLNQLALWFIAQINLSSVRVELNKNAKVGTVRSQPLCLFISMGRDKCLVDREFLYDQLSSLFDKAKPCNATTVWLETNKSQHIIEWW